VEQTLLSGWANDPVHPNAHIYAKMALHIMEKVAPTPIKPVQSKASRRGSGATLRASPDPPPAPEADTTKNMAAPEAAEDASRITDAHTQSALTTRLTSGEEAAATTPDLPPEAVCTEALSTGSSRPIREGRPEAAVGLAGEYQHQPCRAYSFKHHHSFVTKSILSFFHV
jgi:hypothetical protein